MKEVKLDLCKFLGVREGERFTINACDKTNIYKVENNTLLIENFDGSWFFSSMAINNFSKGIRPIKRDILTDKEKDYLESVIYPVRDKVEEIIKIRNNTFSIEFIKIYLKDFDNISLYAFESNTQFKGMEADKKYTLSDLGLEE